MWVLSMPWRSKTFSLCPFFLPHSVWGEKSQMAFYICTVLEKLRCFQLVISSCQQSFFCGAIFRRKKSVANSMHASLWKQKRFVNFTQNFSKMCWQKYLCQTKRFLLFVLPRRETFCRKQVFGPKLGERFELDMRIVHCEALSVLKHPGSKELWSGLEHSMRKVPEEIKRKASSKGKPSSKKGETNSLFGMQFPD